MVSARGDDVFAAFEGAPAALEASLAIQRGMQAGPWPGGNEVRLRVGLHRGRPTLTETGYVGLSVHAAARICFAGHGGQTVMSSAVHAAVPRLAPDGVSLRSLGAWHSVVCPSRSTIFQAEAADRLADFPPLQVGSSGRVIAGWIAQYLSMPTDWRVDGVRVVHAGGLDPNTPQTPGMDREAAIDAARAGAEKLWAGPRDTRRRQDGPASPR